MINVNYEIELNRGWLFNDKDDEPCGETNFVVNAKWLREFWNLNLKKTKNERFEDFLDCYVPEEDGQLIYDKAIENNTLIEDIGQVFY